MPAPGSIENSESFSSKPGTQVRRALIYHRGETFWVYLLIISAWLEKGVIWTFLTENFHFKHCKTFINWLKLKSKAYPKALVISRFNNTLSCSKKLSQNHFLMFSFQQKSIEDVIWTQKKLFSQVSVTILSHISLLPSSNLGSLFST